MRPGCCSRICAWIQRIAAPYNPCSPFLTYEKKNRKLKKCFPDDGTNSKWSVITLYIFIKTKSNCVTVHVCSSRPLADSEKLPVRSHRAAEAPKSPTEDGDAASQEPKKKSSKEKREKKKDKDRDRKVRISTELFLCLLRNHVHLILLNWLNRISKPVNHFYEAVSVSGKTIRRAVNHDDMMSQWLRFPTLLWHAAEFILLFFWQKSKEEKKKKKHKHEEKGEDLLGGEAEEPVVQSEETNEVAAPPTSTSAEVCPYKREEQGCFLPSNRDYIFF